MLGENTIVFYTVDQSSVSWCICLSYWGLDLIRVYSQTLKSCFVILAIYQSNKQTKMVPFEGCTVVQQVAMPPPSSRISAQVTVCADIRLVSAWVFSGFLPPSRNMLLGELAMLNCPEVSCNGLLFYPGCIPLHPISRGLALPRLWPR